jgi:dTDP-6-deoxy-L-talose 4-dehydrogenase (NAD+)
VLVTGATGFVGRHVVTSLLRRGHTVTAVARDVPKAACFDWISDVEFIALDLHGDLAPLTSRVRTIDAMVHLAWPGLPHYKEAFHVEENLPADWRLLDTLLAAGVRRLLVAGTCLEYGMQSGPLAESLPTVPCTAYGIAKDALRKRLESAWQVTPFALQWARLFYLYGSGQHAGSVLAQLDRAIDADEPAFDMSGGEQLRDYLPVAEAAEDIASLIDHPGCQGVINVCSGKPLSVRRLVEEHVARRRARIRLNFGVHPYPDYEPMAFWGDVGRLASIRAIARDKT